MKETIHIMSALSTRYQFFRPLVLTILILSWQWSAVCGQQISGKVMDQSGNGLEGVTVMTGRDTIAITGPTGRFSAGVDSNNLLYFGHEGYISRSYQWNGKEKPAIVLQRDRFNQEAPVPFGSQRYRENPSSVSTISGDQISLMPAQELSSALAGRIPGLTVLETAGDATAGSPAMFIRGRGTMGQNEMLVFIDGFEASIDQLVPAEIESISVFKDAASLAPFGIRGANGVLWVTTKRGFEGKMQVTFESKTGFARPVSIPEFYGAYDYARFYNEAISNDAGTWSPVYSDDELEKFRTGSDPVFYPDVDWYGSVLSTNLPVSENNISVRGGNQLAKYFVMLGYRFSDKIYLDRVNEEFESLKNTGQTERYNFRSSIDLTLNKVFGASIRMGGALLDNASPAREDLFEMISKIPPTSYPVKNPNGTWGGNAIYPSNPSSVIHDMGARTDHGRWLQAGLSLHQDLDGIIRGLSLEESIDLSSHFMSNYDQLRGLATYQPVRPEGSDSITYIQYGDLTTFEIDESERTQWNRNNFALTARYVNRFGPIGTSAMVTYRQDKFLAEEELPYLHSGLAGRLILDLRQTWFAQFSFAYNGSENFPEGNRFGFFPAVSAGWMVSNASFLKNADWIDLLKIRGSAGLTGNDLGPRFGYITYYPEGADYIFGATGKEHQATLTEGRLGNPGITWEKGLKYNVGLDAHLAGGRVGLILDLFRESRYDILSLRTTTVPDVVGALLPYENLSRVSSSGFEAEASYGDRIGSFSYRFGGMVSYARNVIDYTEEIYAEPYLNRTGHPVDQPFGLEAVGFFQSWEEINNPNTPAHTFAPVQPGDIRYKDQNGDGLITEVDEIPIGNTGIPQLVYSADLDLGYKRLDLSVMLYGTANRSIYLEGNYFYAFRNNTQAPLIAGNRWAYYPELGIDTRNEATYPRLSTIDNENNYRRSTFWTENGSFFRIRKVQLGYTIPMQRFSNPLVKNIRIHLLATNPFSWDRLENFDAEVLYGYPLLKSLQLGLKLNL